MTGFRAAGVIGVVLASCGFAAAAGDPSGVWLRSNGNAKIRIESCGSALCGTVVWEKTPSAEGNSYYADGFTSPRAAALTPYTPPPQGQNAVNWTNGMVVLDNSGDLTVKMTNHVAIVNNQVQTLSGTISNLTLYIAPSSGLFLGSFIHPRTGRRTAFRGAVVQNPSESYFMESGGWFLGPSGAGGDIRLKPSEP